MNDRKFVIVVFIVGLFLSAILGIVYSIYTGRYLQASSPSYETYFFPRGGCADPIICCVGRANPFVHGIMYVFMLQNVAKAPISPHYKGIQVM